MKYYLYLFAYLILEACSYKEKVDNSQTQETIKEKINNASTKLKVLDLNAEKIYMLNEAIANKYPADSTGLQLFHSFDDTLKRMRDELITIAGGYTRLGEYANLPAQKEVDAYFYSNNSYRNNAAEYLFKSLQEFDARLKKISPTSQFLEKIDQRFKILINPYRLEAKQMVFKDLDVSEAVAVIESIRSHLAIEQTEYLIER